MKCNPVGWFEIYVQDMARAKAFYESVFQVKLEKGCCPETDMWVFPTEKGGCGAGGALVKKEGVPSGGNSTLIYFCCEDCAVTEGRVATAGGCLELAKTPIGECGFISLVVDTEGNKVGLHSMK
jgi:hypothetical protein